MYSPLQLNQVFSPYDYANIMDHFGKLMELSTNISMAAFTEAYRLVNTMQKRRMVDSTFNINTVFKESRHVIE